MAKRRKGQTWKHVLPEQDYCFAVGDGIHRLAWLTLLGANSGKYVNLNRLLEIPRWVLVALAVRCAQRVVDLFPGGSNGSVARANKNRVEAVLLETSQSAAVGHWYTQGMMFATPEAAADATAIRVAELGSVASDAAAAAAEAVAAAGYADHDYEHWYEHPFEGEERLRRKRHRTTFLSRASVVKAVNRTVSCILNGYGPEVVDAVVASMREDYVERRLPDHVRDLFHRHLLFGSVRGGTRCRETDGQQWPNSCTGPHEILSSQQKPSPGSLPQVHTVHSTPGPS